MPKPVTDSEDEEVPKFAVNFTIGWIEDGTAILLSKDHNIIEIPLSLLPSDIMPGNIMKFTVEWNLKEEW